MFLGSVLQQAIETGGPRFTKTGMTLERASLSLLSGAGTLEDFVLSNPLGFPTGFALRVARIEIGVHPGSLLSEKIHIKHVRVLAPEINFEGGLDNNNLSEILDNVRTATGAGTEAARSSSATKQLLVDEFAVASGKIHVAATLNGGQAFTVNLPDLRFANLGRESGGITVAGLAGKLMSKLYHSARNAVQKHLDGLA